ncbi:MAG TPA: hypothetical protein VK172_14940, partial [Lentimicrobium sp.]|nr:hypothetical protein [Lentimicrobium sp.]
TKAPKTLDGKQTETILRILNDTASYVWGEIGTPYFDTYFTFHDKEGNGFSCSKDRFAAIKTFVLLMNCVVNRPLRAAAKR